MMALSLPRWKLYLLLAGLCCVLIVWPANAQNVLGASLDGMKESQAWWDNLWAQTFSDSPSGSNVSAYIMTGIAKKILFFALIFWIYLFGTAIAKDSNSNDLLFTLGKFLLPVVVVAIFLVNNAANAGLLAYGMRQVINETRNGYLELQVTDRQIRAAVADQMITQDVRNRIGRKAQVCYQMPHPVVKLKSRTRPVNPDPPLSTLENQAYDFMECLETLVMEVEAEQTRIDSQYCAGIPGVRDACKYARNFIDKTLNSFKKAYSGQWNRLQSGKVESIVTENPVSDYVSGFVATLAYSQIFNFTQWLWVNTLELALWLAGLAAPVFIALSLVPGRLNMTVAWLLGYLTIALAQVGYIVIVGAVALMLDNSSTYLASDLRFAMALGLFAPGVSLALFTGGMWQAARSFTGQSTAVVGAVTSIVSGATVSFANAVNRAMDKSR